MPLPIAPILGTLSDNLKLRGSVMPLSGRTAVSWAEGLNLPPGGETVIYTGQLYQMVPLIHRMSRQLHRFENSRLTGLFGPGRRVNRLVNLSGLMPGPGKKEQTLANQALRDIALLLRAAGVEFGYLYKKDLYTGALAFDEGLDEAFAIHARRVHEILKSEGVRRLITVDPHTTDMFKNVYPRMIAGFDIEARSYLEILAERGLPCLRPSDQEVVIHDSCLYARQGDVIDQPRALLKGAGVRIQETELSGRLTHCCGGPAESLFPGKSLALAEKRIGQLSDCAGQVVTMCPLCKASLERKVPQGMRIRDISSYLAEACL